MSSVPSTTWRMLAQRGRGGDLPKGLDAAWDSLVGLANRSLPRARRYLARAAGIVALDKDLMETDENSLWDVKVIATIVGGKILHQG